MTRPSRSLIPCCTLGVGPRFSGVRYPVSSSPPRILADVTAERPTPVEEETR